MSHQNKSTMFLKELTERYGLTKKTLYRRMNILGITLEKDSSQRGFANAEQIKQLDSYNEHIKSGGDKNNYVPMSHVTIDTPVKPRTSRLDSSSSKESNHVTPSYVTPFPEEVGAPMNSSPSKKSNHVTPSSKMQLGFRSVVSPVPSQDEEVDYGLFPTGEPVTTELASEIVNYLQAVFSLQIQTLKSKQGKLHRYEELEKAIEKNWILSTSDVQELIGVKPKGKMLVRGCFRFIYCGKIGRQSGWKVEKID